MRKNIPFYRGRGLSRAQNDVGWGRCVPLRHPGPDPGSIAIKFLISAGFFHHADAPWLDAGSSPARQRWVYALYPQIRPVLVFLTANPVYDIICRWFPCQISGATLLRQCDL